MEEYEVKYQFNSPVPEDCSTDLVPNGAVSKNGKRVIEVPILTSMTKYLFDKNLGNQRQPMYTFLNRLLRNGSLSRIVGCRISNRVINRQACEFPDVTYWKISREEFYADVRVHLTLDTPTGPCEWSGVLICSCEFSIDGFFCEIEELTSYVDRESQGLIMLSPFLIPYYKNKMVDEEAEEMWVRHRMEEALTDPSKRDPQELARRMGLKVVFLPVYEHQNVDGIVFFDDSKLVVGEDYVKKDEQGRKIHHKSDSPQTIEIQADTIVINSNRVQEKYAAFPIFHECFHYDNHFCFAMLQKFASSDRRIRKTLCSTKALEHEANGLYDEMSMLAELTEKCVIENSRQPLNQQEYQRKYNSLVERYETAKARYEDVNKQIELRKAREKVLSAFTDAVKNHTGVITEFDESLWGTLVDQIVVHGRGDVRVVFRDGSEVKNEEFTKSKAIF